MQERSRPWRREKIVKDAPSRRPLVLPNTVNVEKRNNRGETAKKETKIILTLIIT
jgi:hypothetical protein